MALGDYTGMIMGWLLTPAIWLFLIMFFLIGVFGILWLRKKRRLQYKCIELVDLKNRAGFNNLKCGYFGTNLYLRGLWWSGEEVLRTDTGEIIHNFSTEDFQEIDGERGVICYRNPLRQNILLPISQLDISNKDLIATIAPADYTETAVKIYENAVKETSTTMDKLLPIMMIGGIVVFALVSIIMITQMVKTGQAEASNLLLQAGDKGVAYCKDVLNTAITLSSEGNAP